MPCVETHGILKLIAKEVKVEIELNISNGVTDITLVSTIKCFGILIGS